MKVTIYKTHREIKNIEIITGRNGEYEEKLNPYISSDYQIEIENTDKDMGFYLEIINFIVPRKQVLKINERETVLI